MSSAPAVPHTTAPQATAPISKPHTSDSPVCDLLLWKNPINSGKILGGALVSLLVLKKVNIITFFLRLFYTVFFISGSVEFLTKLFLGQGLVTKYGIKECPNTVGFLKPRIDALLKQLPVKQAKMRGLVFAHSPKNTFKAAGVVWVLHKLFSVLSIWTVLFISVIAAFTLPLIYHIYQVEIDTAVNKGYLHAKKQGKIAGSMAYKKASPVLQKVGSRFNKKPTSTSTPVAAAAPVAHTTGASASAL
ncbi:hypothetical protein TBLA_0A01450 [Henningerozyma blattae CBS 6284]|uniref:Reticulon-like protein n=1 Tax=Henningerozyma blattae (strain ATCC 34711 / CBS 6284 / DSM 70876 / NBRC 10599 / NRRL Y-10934 / UCD 77-7) TaxID=1071380 RepID=I2GUZ2_HENB6|nr:hypothetical protein TBLA_0A01450 [Tetrapisispora blattae CBS 6284]CCH57944.1 hypothetical protein TBLA_0A01450 [Tetrapisispora blattae CBS 6284]